MQVRRNAGAETMRAVLDALDLANVTHFADRTTITPDSAIRQIVIDLIAAIEPPPQPSLRQPAYLSLTQDNLEALRKAWDHETASGRAKLDVIPCIKFLREQTQSSLKDAKDYLEANRNAFGLAAIK